MYTGDGVGPVPPDTDLADRPGRHRISQRRTYPHTAAAVLARSTEPTVLRHFRDHAGQRLERSYRRLRARADRMFVTECEASRLPAALVYCAGGGADVSVCQRLNSLPCGSLQAENQPMPGTGIGSFASPPSSFTRAAPALMSSTAKYGRMPCLPGSMFVIAAPCSPPICVVWYSNGPGLAWNCQPNKEPQNCWLLVVSSAGISMCTISPGNAASLFRRSRRCRRRS